MKSRLLAFLITALALSLFSRGVHAQETGSPETRAASPEAGAAEVEATSSPHLDQIEFRSIASLPGGMIFSLRDPSGDNTFWIELGQIRNEIEAVEFDPDRNTLTVRHGDAVKTLSLAASRILTPQESRAQAATSNQGEEWRQRREEWADFMQRWRSAAEDTPELREIETHFRELMGELRTVNGNLSSAEEGSEAHERLTTQRNELAQEFRLLNRYTAQTLTAHPDFEQSDMQMAQQMFRMGWNQPRGD